ncbi:MAG: hypothetical protein E7394_00330 [Ruminococcaceae bacterium]|nr:hypothetical protein [Oscillospiraceae bacterium]
MNSSDNTIPTKDENINPEFQNDADASAEREEKILRLSERMLEKISSAIDELSLYQAKEKERVKEVEYDEENKKVIKETNVESEKIDVVESLIDTGALKQLVSTLKDIKDIHVGLCQKSDYDGEESGVIMISPIDENFEEHEVGKE